MAEPLSRPGSHWVRTVGARTLLVAVAAVILSTSCKRVATGSRHATAKPNILLISVDTFRPDHLGVYGYPRATSPRIDALARDGITFDEAVTPIPKTTPGLTSLLSGLYPKTHRVFRVGQRIPPGVPFVSGALRKIGYVTFGVCGQYNCSREFGFMRGFDGYDDQFVPSLKRGAWTQRVGGGFYPDSERRAEDVVNSALSWLTDRKREQPYFMWIHLMDPHAGYSPPPPFDEMFDSTREGVAPSPRAGDSVHGTNIPVPFIHSQALVPGETRFSNYLDRYDGEIRYADHYIGRLLDWLRRDQSYDDTLIIVTADHGEYMGESTWRYPVFDHGWSPYEADCHVPLIVKLPRSRMAGRRSAALVSLVDVVPTIGEVVGIHPGSTEGVSLFVPLRDALRGRSHQIIQVPKLTADFIVRHLDHKVVFRTGLKIDELLGALPRRLGTYAKEAYDLRVDALERTNVIHQKRAWIRQAGGELDRWLNVPPAVVLAGHQQAKPSPEMVEHVKALGYMQ